MSDDRENTEAEERTPRSWWAKIRAQGGPWLLTTLGGLIVTTIAVYIWIEGFQKGKTWYAESQNISYDEALAEAKENVGASAIDVVPFRNADSKQQYIAVVTTPPQTETPPRFPDTPDNQKEAEEAYKWHLSEEYNCAYTKTTLSPDGPPPHQCYPITILRKTEDFSPEIVDPVLVACDFAFDNDKYRVVEGTVAVGEPTPEEEYRNSLWGVVDLDDDGNKEVYSVYRAHTGAGTGPYMVKVWLYDSLTGEVYELTAEAEVTSATLNPQFTNEPPKESFSAFMYQKADALTWIDQGGEASDEDWQRMTEQERYQHEVRIWLRNHGEGFYEGSVKVEAFEGPPPETGTTIVCSLVDGDFEWWSYFKGAMFGFDKTKDIHYVLWVPDSNYAWVTSIVAGQRYLWLSRAKDGELLTYNKDAQALVLLPIPELEETPTAPLSPLSESARIDLLLKGSTLYGQWMRPGQTSFVKIPLTLPEEINMEEEFESAASCDGP
jgi:hypothetical protein